VPRQVNRGLDEALTLSRVKEVVQFLLIVQHVEVIVLFGVHFNGYEAIVLVLVNCVHLVLTWLLRVQANPLKFVDPLFVECALEETVFVSAVSDSESLHHLEF